MESTNEFVNKVHDTQQKDEKNKRTQGVGTPSQQLANKQHSTNK